MTTSYSVTTGRRSASMLEAFFRPRGVAIAGASSDASNPGHAVLVNLLEAGFSRPLAVIQPGASTVLGVPAYPDLDSVPGPVEMLVLALPPHTTPDIVQAIGRRARHRRDLKVVVAISVGFAETGTAQGRAWQEELAAGCHAAGVRLMGPNSAGVTDHRARLDTSLLSGLHRRPGGISLLSESGAMSAWLGLQWASLPISVGLNKMVSLGNAADVATAEVLDYLGQDQSSRAIGLCLESLPDGQALLAAAGVAAQRKPVVLLANAGDGALAVDRSLQDGTFSQHGLVLVDRADDFAVALNAFDKLPLPLGGRVAVLTNAGGPGHHTLDALRARGLTMGRLSPAATAMLRETLPPFANVGEPDGLVEMTGGVGPRQAAQAVAATLRDPGVDAVVFLFVPTRLNTAEPVAAELLQLLPGVKRNSLDKPFFPVLLAGQGGERARRLLEENAILTFASPNQAATALTAMVRYSVHRRTLTAGPADSGRAL